MRPRLKALTSQILIIVLSFSSVLLSPPLLSRSTESLDMQWSPVPFGHPITAMSSDENVLYITTQNESGTKLYFIDSPFEAENIFDWEDPSLENPKPNLQKKHILSMKAFHIMESNAGGKLSAYLLMGTEKDSMTGIKIKPENEKRNLPYISSLPTQGKHAIRAIHQYDSLDTVFVTIDNNGIFELNLGTKTGGTKPEPDPKPLSNLPKNSQTKLGSPSILSTLDKGVITFQQVGQLMEHWKPKPNSCYDMHPFSSDHIWALTNQGIFETTDSTGQRDSKGWAFLNKQPSVEIMKGSQKVPIQAVSYTIHQFENTLWVVTSLGVFTTKDNGKTWILRQDIPAESFLKIPVYEKNYQTYPDKYPFPSYPFISTHPDFHNHIWIASPTEVFHSQDRGVTWKALPFDAPLSYPDSTIKGFEILKIKDNGGNVIPLPIVGLSDGQILRYMVDTTPPEIESLSLDNQKILQNNQKVAGLEEPVLLEMKDNQKPILQGSIKQEPGSPIKDILIQIGEGKEFKSIITAYDSNTPSFSTPLDLDENIVTTITLKITDNNGNDNSLPSFKVKYFKEDVTSPKVESLIFGTIELVRNNSLLPDENKTQWIKTQNPVIEGRIIEEGSGIASIICLLDNKKIEITADENGYFSQKIELEEDNKVILGTFQVTDRSNNVGKEFRFKVQVDTKEPLITIKEPEKNKSPVDIYFSVSEEGSGIKSFSATHNNDDVASKVKQILQTQQFYLQAIELQQGENIITIQATDEVGNIGAESITIQYGESDPEPPNPPKDNTPPVIIITNPPSEPDPYPSPNRQIVIQGSITDKESDIQEATINGIKLPFGQDGSFTFTYELKEGLNTIILWAINKVNLSAEKTLRISYTPTSPPPENNIPVITIHSHTNGQVVNNKEISLSGTVTDPDQDVQSVTITMNKDLIPVTFDKDGSFSQTLTLQTMKNNIQVDATDQQGNRAEGVSLTITYLPKNSTLITLWIGKKEAEITKQAIMKPTFLEAPPEIKNGKTMVPLRFVGEAFGAKVDWNAKSSEITIPLGKKILSLWIGIDYIFVDNEGEYEEIPLDSPPYIKNGRTMVPIRAISEAFGAKVEWDAKEKKITILYTPEETTGP